MAEESGPVFLEFREEIRDQAEADARQSPRPYKVTAVLGGQPIYEERLGLFWVIAGPIGVFIAAGLLFAGIIGGYDPLAGAGVALIVLSIVWSVTVVGIERYSRIKLDSAELRVGRASVAVSHIATLLAESEIPTDVLDRAASPFPSKGPGGRLFGGGWGLGERLQPIGFTISNDDEIRVIGTRHPDRLLQDLRSSIGASRA